MKKKKKPTVQPSPDTNRLENLRRLVDDEEYYFGECLKIITKRGSMKPFKLNPVQKRVKEILDKQEKETGMIRAVILKARQHGISTYVQGKFYHRSSTRKFRRSLVVSHELDSAEHIFGMSKIFLQECPGELVPMTKRSNRREILFENPDYDPKKANNPGLRSYIHVDTAKDVNVGASKTVNQLHLSEVARWLNASVTLISLLQAVPKVPGTIVIFESTALGVGGEFWKRYWDAKEGRSDYVAIFIPWFENPEYVMPLAWNEKLILTEEEAELKVKFKLSDEQIKWRRDTIHNECGGDFERFKQEYPCTDEEAFLTSGTRKYPLDHILQAEKSVIPPEFVGDIEEDQETRRIKPTHRVNGPLQIWLQPQPGRQYVVAGDVGEGITDRDFSVATVWDHHSWEQAALWRGRVSPEDFGYILCLLGWYYNNGMVACESNGIGLASCVVMKNHGYPNIYYSRKKDEKTLERTRKIGFLTTSRTRSIGISLLGQALRDADLTIRAKEITNELRTFISKDGRVEAEEGCNDDCVLSSVIFVSVATELPPADFAKEKAENRAHIPYRGGVRRG